MEQVELFLVFTERLEQAGITYMATGSVASMLYGIPRFTHDIDVVVDVSPPQLQALSDAFPLEEFYCPPDEVLQIECRRPQARVLPRRALREAPDRHPGHVGGLGRPHRPASHHGVGHQAWPAAGVGLGHRQLSFLRSGLTARGRSAPHAKPFRRCVGARPLGVRGASGVAGRRVGGRNREGARGRAGVRECGNAGVRECAKSDGAQSRACTTRRPPCACGG